MRIFLQVPAGLKTKALELAVKMEKEGNHVFISCENFYGSCDLREHEARALKCDKIIHYGHTKFMDSEIPVEYREVQETMDVVPIIERDLDKINSYQKIGLTASLQFLSSLEKVKSFLDGNGKTVQLAKEKSGSRVLHPGQVLGCDVSGVPGDVDCILHIGSGKFHALGEALRTKKPVFVLDVERGEIKQTETDLFEKQKYAAIGLAKHAKNFGILVSSKKGQFNPEAAEEIKKKLEKNGKQAFILVMDEFSPQKLMGIHCDCFVNTACPRIAIEDRILYDKPLINVDELGEVLK